MTNSQTTSDHITTRGCHWLPTALLLMMTAMVGWAADDASFHLTCDGTVNADVAAGVAVPTVTGQVRYHPGVYGQALEVGETGATLTFPSQGNLPLAKGTVEMWLLPVKWTLGEEGHYLYHHVFFRAQDANAWFQIYKFERHWFWCVRGKDSDFGALQALVTTRATVGRWVHLVTTWDGDAVTVYTNGLPSGKLLRPMPSLPPTFVVGDLAWEATRNPQTTLIDDLHIYNRPLTPAEIQSRFAAGIAAIASKIAPNMTVPTCEKPPVIDGKSTPGEWAMASLLRGFRYAAKPPQGDDALGIDSTFGAFLSHDSKNLYLAFQRQMEPGVTLVSKKRERDADLSQDDSVLVDLAPGWDGTTEPKEFYRFEVNLSGSRADSKTGEDGTRDSSWNPEWQAGASAENLDRLMEFAIPFEALGRPTPTDKERWAVRFVSRVAINGGAKSEIFWGGNNPKAWGGITLSPSVAGVQVNTISCTRKGDVGLKAALVPGDPSIISTEVFADAAGSTTHGLNGGGGGRIADQGVSLLETGLLNRITGEFLWYDKFAVELDKGAVLSLTLRPSLGVGQLAVSVLGSGIDPAKSPVLIELLEKSTGKAAFSKEITEFPNGAAALDLPIKDLAGGDYIVRSTVRLPGVDGPSIKEVLFSKPDMPWKGNKVGILDDQQVPEPWTPLVVKNNETNPKAVISCWGREYIFEGSPLPSQIISQGKGLLASPSMLVSTQDGVDTVWKTSDFKIVNATPAKVTFQGKASLGGTEFTINGRIEYDGMIWFTLEGDLQKSSFDQINFVMPMRQDMATYRLIAESVQRNADHWTSGFVNSIWFGNEKIGISWFAESEATWKSIPAVPRFDLSQAGDAQVFRVNLAAGGTADAKGHFEFGLHATPSRPLPKNWRALSMRFLNAWVSPWQTEFHGYPKLPPGKEEESLDRLHKMADEVHKSGAHMADSVYKSGAPVIPYLHSCMLSSASPEWSYFSEEWKNPGNIFPFVPPNEASHSGLYGVCPASDGWTDFDVFTIRDYLVKTNMDGVYHDFGSPSICANPLHGCNGKMPILAYRELHKRLYVMMRELGKERGRPSYYAHHASICSTLIVPSLVSFADTIVDSEQLGSQVPRLGADMYIRQVPLDYYRIRGNAKTFGLANNFIICSGPVLPANYGMCVLHDIVSQFGGPGYLIWEPIRQALFKFGLDNEAIEFRGYWENLGGATITGFGLTSEDVLMSLFVHPGQRSLAVMVNRSKTQRTETLTFDWKSLGLPENSQVSDLLTGETIAPNADGGYPIKFDALSARYIVAGQIPSVK